MIARSEVRRSTNENAGPLRVRRFVGGGRLKTRLATVPGLAVRGGRDRP